MKRFGALLITAFMASLFLGCDGGLQEGPPTGPLPESGQPSGFREMMEKQGKDMQTLKKGRPKDASQRK